MLQFFYSHADIFTLIMGMSIGQFAYGFYGARREMARQVIGSSRWYEQQRNVKTFSTVTLIAILLLLVTICYGAVLHIYAGQLLSLGLSSLIMACAYFGLWFFFLDRRYWMNRSPS